MRIFGWLIWQVCEVLLQSSWKHWFIVHAMSTTDIFHFCCEEWKKLNTTLSGSTKIGSVNTIYQTQDYEFKKKKNTGISQKVPNLWLCFWTIQKEETCSKDNKSIINTASWKKKLNKILLYFSSVRKWQDRPLNTLINNVWSFVISKKSLQLFITEGILSVTLFLYICTKFLNKMND